MTPKEIVVEEVEFLTTYGLSPERIAAKLGIGLAGVARACERCDRYDLARPFRNAYRASRKHPCVDCGRPVTEPRAERCHPCGTRHRNDSPDYMAALMAGIARRDGRTAA